MRDIYLALTLDNHKNQVMGKQKFWMSQLREFLHSLIQNFKYYIGSSCYLRFV